jgi:segregation and condensation protein B
MDETAAKRVIEAALLAAGRPLSFDKLVEIFSRKGVEADRAVLRAALSSLAKDYMERGIELKEVASGYRVQVRSSMRDWLDPLFEERAPRYSRALLETLALIAYRQPITRAEIEEVRGVSVSSNIVRTVIERGWVRVVGYREVPGKPAMLGTTREFLDYFGLSKLEDLPPLAEIRELGPTEHPQSDLIDQLEETLLVPVELDIGDDGDGPSVDEDLARDAAGDREEGGPSRPAPPVRLASVDDSGAQEPSDRSSDTGRNHETLDRLPAEPTEP